MIFINGCSFTAGSDDNDSWVKGFYSENFGKWKTGIPNHIDQPGTIKNVAGGGASNGVIRRKTFYYLNNPIHQEQIEYAIIQWSTIDRWDYPVFVTEDKASNFPRLNMHPERVGSINYMHNGSDVFGYGKDFYEKYYSLYGAVIETLENIYHTQQYLKEKNVPYKMITIGNLMDMEATLDNLQKLNLTKQEHIRGDYSILKCNIKNIFEKLEKYNESWYELDNIKSLIEKIDFTKFLFTDNENINGFGGGIIEWFLNKKETLTGGAHHPSEEQHIRFFNEFLWPKIKDEINAVTKQTTNNRLPI